MKIATLTYQRHDNYGAMLQCYALQKKLGDIGAEAEVIDYVCEVSEKPFSIAALRAKGVKRYITGAIGALTRLPRAKKFREFRRNHLNLTQTVTEKNISRLGAIYDGYIVGSDNVWNADITGLDERYFLSFVADKRKRTSYAASFGNAKIKSGQMQQYKELIEDIAVLNLREKTGAELAQKLTGRQANVVCDPTLLLSRDEWETMAENPNEKGKYLLAYQMVPSKRFVDFVKAVAKQKGLRVVYVPFPYGVLKCRTKMRIGPCEWLGLFRDAEYILTDSFHGCVFSVIFQKQFSVCISQLGERIENLLSVLDIKQRRVDGAEDVGKLDDINYKIVNERLENFRKSSERELDALIKYFSDIKNEGENGIVDPSRCTGCRLCEAICPSRAISVKKDKLGFLYPDIMQDKCIHCSLCEKACAKLNDYKQRDADAKYYAVINSDSQIVSDSASGGVFTALAESILEKQGMVFAAAYNENFSICHIGISNAADIGKLRGTKYPQSNIYSQYTEVMSALGMGKTVLFVGTSCQCSALREYLKMKKATTEKLFVVDLLCNGVFSPTMWEEHLRSIEKKFGRVEYVSFRDKAKGWRNKHMKIIAGGRDISDYCNSEASVLQMYEQKIGFRESCYQCRYMSTERVGDMSIGDFWGIERVKPGLDKNTGVSVVSVNNEKGEQLFDELKKRALCEEFSRGEVLQPVLRGFNTKNSHRSDFIRTYAEGGIDAVTHKYGRVTGKKKLKRDVIIPVLYKLRIAGAASKILHLRDE